jgi:hypothetical protein
MTDADALRERVLQRLQSAEGPWRAQLHALAIDHLLALRVGELVELDALRQLLSSALVEDNVRRAVQRHVAPGFARYGQAARATETRLHALIAPSAQHKLQRIAQRLRLPPARWLGSAVDPAQVRQLLGPVWTQVLVNFAKRLPLPGVAAAASPRSRPGLTSMLSRTVQEQAEKLVDRGRSMMGGLGQEVERRLVAAARDFSDSAAQLFRDALIERLDSAEGQRIVAEISTRVIEQLAQARIADLQADVDALPIGEILELVPELVSQSLTTQFVQDVVQSELAHWLTLEGDRSLAELLDESGLRPLVVSALASHLDQYTASFSRSPAFEDWLKQLFDE